MPEKAAEPPKRFEDMDLSPQMLKALLHANYETPTPVQAGVIPAALEGVDVIGQARTGTGKTASFVIPILEDLLPKREAADTQALILVPTKELALQLEEVCKQLSHHVKLKCYAVCNS
jgi:ATP-dependent RNA helicase DeaD